MAAKRPARAAASGTRGTPVLASQARASGGQRSSPTPSDPDPVPPDVTVKNCEQARLWLENKNLLVPIGSKVTLPMLSMALFHISELAKMPGEIAQAIRSVAWLVGEVEMETVAEATRSAVNDQIDFLNTEAKNLLDEMRTTISEEVEKQIGSLGTAVTKVLEEKKSSTPTYRDMLLGNAPSCQSVDPRILAREGIRARQFIVDLPADNPLKSLSQFDTLQWFNEAMDKAGKDLGEGEGTIRSVMRLPNKGLLGEFMHDAGAKWFAIPNHADEFLAALGVDGVGAVVKKRSHPMIAYYVPLNLNTSNPAHLAEIAEANNFERDDILGIRWAKPPARRSPNQICGHLIINFSGPDAANRAKTEGLVICNKRVSVAKYKKEPIRCLKCQGWNHVAAECIQPFDRCGTCGARDHRTSVCASSSEFCANCETEGHTSWSRNCPTFVRKCQEFDAKHPENSLPYYPSKEPWTWASAPQCYEEEIPIRRPGPPPPVRFRQATQRLRQTQIRFAPIGSQAANPTGPPTASNPLEPYKEFRPLPVDPPFGQDLDREFESWYV
jgi:hypothetical protein